MSQPAQILVVDDEMAIRVTMAEMLKRRGYEVEMAANGEEAMAHIYQRPFDLLLLDLKMPGMDGVEVARRARERQPDAAIIILTGHGSLDSAMEGIHLGIFDYMLKTTSPHDVLARIQAALAQRSEERRRQQLLQTLTAVLGELKGDTPAAPAPGPADEWIAVGDLHISTWKQMARLGDKTLSLTPTEFRVLVCLAQQAGQVMSHQQIVRCAQGYDTDIFEATELVKPHIYHLRQKMEADPSNPRYILTVRGTGYLLAATPDEKKG